MNDPQKEAREIAARHGVKMYEPPAETGKQEPYECRVRKALDALLESLYAVILPLPDSIREAMQDARAADPCPCEQLRRAEQNSDGLYREVVKRLRGALIVSGLGEWTEWQAAIDLFLRSAQAQSHFAKLASDRFDRITSMERTNLESSGELAAVCVERDRLRTESDRAKEEVRKFIEAYDEAVLECYGEGMGEGSEEMLSDGIARWKRLGLQGIALRTVFGEAVWNLSDEETAEFCKSLVSELAAARSLLEEARLAMVKARASGSLFLLNTVLAKIEAAGKPEVKP